MVKPRENRVPIMMSEEELTSIDDWRFKSRIATRSEAIRRLCQIGLMFDSHRVEFSERYLAILDAGTAEKDLAATIAVRAGKELGETTEAERKLARSVLDTLRAAMEMYTLIRLTTGVANNFKDERDIGDIIAEAKEILAPDDSEA